VGKSSLISTFVSRHFSEVVPGIMTRVRLPPDPENSCITTIVDSQGGDAALMSAVTAISLSGGGSSGSLSTLQKSLSTSTSSNIGGIENVDSIILIYDLDRVETFFRLENHWLPLIERCYNGEVSTVQRTTYIQRLSLSCVACFWLASTID
jgi:Ras family protein T1